MSVERRVDGTGRTRWRARYRGPDRRERTKTFDRKVDAEAWISERQREMRKGDWVDPRRSELTLYEWAELWIDTKRGKKPKTIEGYRSLLRSRVLPVLGYYELRHITPDVVERWVADMEADGLSASRIRQAHQVLSAMLGRAVRDRRIAHNVAKGIELPRERQREMHFLSASQVLDLAEAAGAYRPLVLTLAYGGLRWAEAVGLRVGRVNLLHRRLEIAETLSEVAGHLEAVSPKSGSRRVVVIPRFLAAELEPLIAGRDRDELVFTAPRGGPLRHTNFYRGTWARAVASAGVPATLRIHDLRHTCAALLIAQGAHAKAIQSHLGHADVRLTLDRYGHLLPGAFEQLADRLDDAFEAADADFSRTSPVSELPRTAEG